MAKKKINAILETVDIDETLKGEIVALFEETLKKSVASEKAKTHKKLREKYEKDSDASYTAYGQYMEARLNPLLEHFQSEIEAASSIKGKLAEKYAELDKINEEKIEKYLDGYTDYYEKRFDDNVQEVLDEQVSARKAALQTMADYRKRQEELLEKIQTSGAMTIEHIVEHKYAKAFDNLREDIKKAQEDNFGRELFEAFKDTFQTMFFNASDEHKKLVAKNLDLVSSIESAKDTMNKINEEKDKEIADLRRKYQGLQESVDRSRKINSLLKPLTGESKKMMKTILESTTNTKDLEAVFKKTYREMVRGKTPSNPRLSMNQAGSDQLLEDADLTVRTGGVTQTHVEGDEELMALRKAIGAGLG